MGGIAAKGRLSASTALCLIALMAAPAAVAQTATPQAPAATEPSDQGALADVVVTAERRTQRLQDVPISATVLSGSELVSRGVTNPNDLQQVAPSVAINTYNRSTYINIRGIGIAQSQPTSSPGVAYYVDGVLIPHEQLIGLSFYDIASIEVLRGPQGTLAGQNSTGGAVYVRTPQPRFDEMVVTGDLTIGDYGKRRALATLSAGLSDAVAVQLAYLHDERDSFTTNIGRADVQPGNLLMDGARAALFLRSPDEALKIAVHGEYFNSRSDNNAVKNRADAVTANPYVIEEDANSYLNLEGYRLSTEGTLRISDGLSARAMVSWQDATQTDQVDGDRTATALPVPAALPTTGANTTLYPGRIGHNTASFRTLVSEINLLSGDKGPVRWVIGGFLLDENIPVELLRDNRNTREYVSSSSTIQTLAHNNSKSLFGQANWFVTEKIELLAGARHSWDRQDYTRFIAPGVTAPFTTSQISSEWTGKVGANLHLGRTLLYVTGSKGYKAGGVNLGLAQGNFQPERNYVVEGGIKTELLDRHLRLNGDVFHSTYKGIQFNSLIAGLPVTQNALAAKSWGAELEATAQFGGFQANGGLSYLDSTFSGGTCLNNPDSSTVDALCPAGNQFVPDGRRTPFAPKWTINAGVQYRAVLSDILALTPRVQWSHLDQQYATPFPSIVSLVPGRDVFDARLTLDIDRRYTIEGFVTNLTDRHYIASQVQSATSATGGILYGAPRQYGLRLAVRFGK